MPIVITWKAGTPLGDASAAVPAAPYSYEIEGTLATRTGQGLTNAIAAEVGLDPSKVAVSGTDVLVDGQALLTLADSATGIDAPSNNWLARHLRGLMQNARGDRRTQVWMVLKMIARYARFSQTLTRAQWTTVAQRAYDAVTTSNADGA